MPNKPDTGPKRVSFTNWAIIFVAIAMWMFLGLLVTPSSKVHDFLNIYTGSNLALEGRFSELHRPDVQLAEEKALVPSTDRLVPFVRPHFYAAILSPLALLPFGTAFWTWIAIQTLLLFGCWYWGFREFPADSVVISALYLPTALGIAHGQDGVLMLIVSIAAYATLKRGNAYTAGCVLALGLIKFHLFLLWPLAMLVARNWRMLAGFCTGGAGLALVSLGLGGMEGAKAYVGLLTNKDLERLSPTPEFMINAQSIAANLADGSMVVQASWTVLTLVMWLVAIWNAPLWRWWAATALAGLLVVPHTYGYDASLLLLPFWLMLFANAEKRLKIVATLASTPLPFLLTLADKPWSVAAALSLTAVLVTMALQKTQKTTMKKEQLAA